ncbi:MAG: histidine phosphatase family protein [Acidimicrobiales bacterium]|nr:histidine phosphatase family protein [Acidimicrobiales bacterium]
MTRSSPVNEPAWIWLLRHGQSQGNVIRDAAKDVDLEVLDIPDRDMDVPLSDLGRRQAVAFGRWLSGQPPASKPEVVLSSPYVRAWETAELVVDAAGLDVTVHRDERLRERELGVLDLLTQRGVMARHPEEAERRRRLGKFYHRPPGGESWVDVALRLRSLRDSIGREHTSKRVLIIAHEVVIVVMRYLLEDLDEAQALALGGGRLANCSLTSYETMPDGSPRLQLDGWTAPLDIANEVVTDASDAPVASR